METNNERIFLLRSVINLDPNYADAIKQLENYKWDFDGNPVVIGHSHFQKILLDYIQGVRTAKNLHEWAEFLELREDIDFSGHNEELLSEILHELANPDLEGELTSERAKEIIAKL